MFKSDISLPFQAIFAFPRSLFETVFWQKNADKKFLYVFGVADFDFAIGFFHRLTLIPLRCTRKPDFDNFLKKKMRKESFFIFLGSLISILLLVFSTDLSFPLSGASGTGFWQFSKKKSGKKFLCVFGVTNFNIAIAFFLQTTPKICRLVKKNQ